MSRSKKKTISGASFPELPEYPGGKKAFTTFLTENMRYPKRAVENNVEGDVYVRFNINDNGAVEDVKVEKGIGYGCDEEAERLVKMLEFGSARNRGYKLSVSKKIKIRFRLKNIKKSLSYTYSSKASKNQNDTSNEGIAKAPTVYEYSITVPKK